MEHAQVMSDRSGSGDNNSLTSPPDSLGVATITSTDSAISGVSVYSEHTGVGIVRVDSENPSIQSNGNTSQPTAGSPQRSVHSAAVSSPGSSVKVDHPPTTPQMMSPAVPQVPPLDYNDSSVLLGVQQLERQQLELERRRYVANPTQSNAIEMMHASPPAEDDEHTEPSSTVTGTTGGENPNLSAEDATSTFGRLIQNTRRRMGSGERPRSGSEGEDLLEGVLICGYLQKLGRNGKWQTRWFETDGECLTYYKSSKRLKLLATLDLAKVGSIVVNDEDPKGTQFTINISERPYHLQADSKAACKDWVITLNRVKEARMQEGNVKLIMPRSGQPLDLLDNTMTPRVVVVANRERTRAVDGEVMHAWEQDVGWADNPANYNDVAPPSSNRLARWQKPRTSMSRIAAKLLRWARSLRKYSCAAADTHVMLDRNIHPPGHDYKPKISAGASENNSGKDVGHAAWIGKEATGQEVLTPVVSNGKDRHELTSETLTHSTSATPDRAEDEEETRELS